MRVEREVGVAGDGEVVHRERVEHLGRLNLARDRLRSAYLGKTVGDKENEDDEETVCGALDLEVAEEGVGTKEVEGLVNDIRFPWIRCKT